MFPLLELPIELIEHVVTVVHPRDIEALSRCGSRLLRDLTKKRLIKHYKLKSKYTCIRLCGEEHQFRGRSSNVDDWRPWTVIPSSAPDFIHYRSRTSMLKDIFRNRDLASYPKYVSLGSYFFRENIVHGPWTLDREKPHWSVIMSDVTAFVGSLDIPTDMKKTWVEAIYGPNNKSAAVALIVSLLTDVQVLKMEDWRSGICELDPLWGIVTHIAMSDRNSSNLGEFSTSERPLSRLRRLSIEASPVGHSSIQEFVPFASLPSILDLHGVCIYDRVQSEKTVAWQWPIGFPDRGSSVTSIHLEVSTFETFLGGIAALREFTYQHDQYLSPEAIQWDPRGVVAVLRSYAVNSLTSLNLTTRPERVLARTKDVHGDFVGSPQMSAALKYIRVDDRLLAGPERAISHLVDVLPRNVEYLTLIPDQWWKKREELWGVRNPQNECLKELFRGFPKLRERLLPELQKVVIESYWPVDDLRQSLGAVDGVCSSLQFWPLRWEQSDRYFIEYTTSRKSSRDDWFWPATWPPRPREWAEYDGEWNI